MHVKKLELLKKISFSGISQHVSLPVKKINLDNDTIYTSMKTRKRLIKAYSAEIKRYVTSFPLIILIIFTLIKPQSHKALLT